MNSLKNRHAFWHPKMGASKIEFLFYISPRFHCPILMLILQVYEREVSDENYSILKMQQEYEI